MPQASIAPSTTQPTMPSGRRRGMRERDEHENRSEDPVHRASITGPRRNLTGKRGVFPRDQRTTRSNAMGTTPRNEGEGNKSADRNYREATQKFVESERGREEIEKAGEVDRREAAGDRARRGRGEAPRERARPAGEAARKPTGHRMQHGRQTRLGHRFRRSDHSVSPSPAGSQRTNNEVTSATAAADSTTPAPARRLRRLDRQSDRVVRLVHVLRVRDLLRAAVLSR